MNLLGTSFDDLVVLAATAALALVSLWGLAVVVAVLVEALTDGRLSTAARIGCPPQAQRVLLGLFVALLTVTTVPATAQASARPEPVTLDGLSLPGRVTGDGAGPERAHDQDPARARPGLHTVAVGDTLWRLAARGLPTGASDAEIARAVRDLHGLNRTVIGPDPDLLRPGQRLLLSSPHPETGALPKGSS